MKLLYFLKIIVVIIIIIIVVVVVVVVVIIIIITAAVYSKGDFFFSVARITRRIADNARRAGESHLEYREQLHETPI